MDWMIFYNEVSGDHFIYNGENNIGLRVGEDFDPIPTDPNPSSKATLDQVLNTPRLQGFRLDGVKYGIVTKGNFHQL